VSEITCSGERSAFGRRLGFGYRPLLLVIDVTRAFTEAPSPLATECADLIRVVNRLTNSARRASVPVLFTTVTYDDPNFADAGVWALKIGAHAELLAGASGVELAPRVKRSREEPILTKKYASCFFGTDLASRLTSAQRDTLILTGMTTSGCVRATSVDAIQSGFRTIVARDAVGDRWPDAHDQALRDMDAKYADVVASTEIENYLSGLTSA
jgi:maleamate amidohydrolase